MSTREPEEEGQSDPGATSEREAQESLERVERGGIPIAAERRLRELGEADGGAGAFTSDLSVGSFALCHELGFKPLAQVMGSSIYQVGYSTTYPMYQSGGMYELQALSQAWNEVRDRAFARLAQEAELLGADAVVGVQIDAGGREYTEGAIECIVVGTAVKRSDSARPAGAPPIMTELSVPDFAKLHRAGIGTLGVVAWTSVFFVSGWSGGGQMGGGGMAFGGVNFMQNQELTGFTQGVYEARESVMRRIDQQASQLGANGIVGMRIGHSVRPMDAGGGQYQQRGLMVSFNAIGTAIETGDGRQIAAPETILDLSEEGATQT
jgi:uncharacterized protein YbjQ (UPF0145 family)